MTGDDDYTHSFGHSDSCYWCGLSGDDPEIEKPCDERVNKKPSAEAMAAYYEKQEIATRISDLASFDYALTESIEWSELIAQICALRPDRGALINRLGTRLSA